MMVEHIKNLDGRKPLEKLSHARLVVIARNIKGKTIGETIEIPLMSRAHLCLLIRGHKAVPPEYR
jgi:hypothetical protein